MPQAIPLIASAAVVSIPQVAALGAFASAVIGGAVAYGTSRLLGLDEPPKIPDPGININVRGTVAPIPIVYGRRRVGGVIAQAVSSGNIVGRSGDPEEQEDGRRRIDTEGTDNKFLNMVICWSEGEIEGVQLLYFGDDTSTRSRYAGYFEVEHFTGTDDQLASPGLLAALALTYTPEYASELWTSEHRLRGIAYSYVKLTYKQSVWISGAPQITADIKGRKVLDLRTDTWAWSDNPALCIYDYLTNTRFGRGIDPSEIDANSFIDAANYCEQDVFIQTGGDGISEPIVGVTQARYGCDAVLNPDDSLLDNLRILLGTCRGALVYSGGLYKLKLEKPEVPTFALTEDNIVGGWNIALESGQTRFNRVQVQWINKSIFYQSDISFLESAAFLASDNNEVLEARIELPATTNPYRPLQMAGIALRQSRYSLQCEVLCTIEGLAVEVFDVVTVTHETPGWDGQLFRVMGISLEGDDQVRLQLTQYADDVYDLESQNEADSPPATALLDPRTVSDIELFGAAKLSQPNGDGTTRYYYALEWATLYDVANLRGFNLRWREVGVADWQSTIIPYQTNPTSYPGRLHAHFLYVRPGVSHEVELEAFNSLGVVGATFASTLTPLTIVPI